MYKAAPVNSALASVAMASSQAIMAQNRWAPTSLATGQSSAVRQAEGTRRSRVASRSFTSMRWTTARARRRSKGASSTPAHKRTSTVAVKPQIAKSP